MISTVTIWASPSDGSSLMSSRAPADEEANAQNLNGTTEDTREAIRAFLEKRDPVFRNR